MKVEGHIKVLGGPYVARGPDVAQGLVNTFNLCMRFLRLKRAYVGSFMPIETNVSTKETSL